MGYVKPKGISYVDMAIYIDKHIYEPDYDANTIYQYLYFLTGMLAFKQRFFEKGKQYDDFAYFAATYIFMRLTNKKQFEWDSSKHSYKLEKVKSVLNYIKKTLYAMKVRFEQLDYSQQYVEVEDFVPDSTNQVYLANQANKAFKEIEFFDILENVNQIIDEILLTTPYKNSMIQKYIKISCLLSILNLITINNEQLEILKDKNVKWFNSMHFIEKIFSDLKKNYVILYKIPQSMGNFIDITVKKIFKEIGKDISELIDDYNVTDTMAKNILIESIVSSEGGGESWG